MALIQYSRSAATVSWIDAATGLPEVDKVAPGQTVERSFLTGNTGFRFVNFMEVWASYDTKKNTIVSHGFTPASKTYTSPSFADIPSFIFEPIRNVKVGREPITFTQIIGARTESPEKIGGIFGPLGNIAASAITAFPPIWSELEIKIYNDGRTEASVLRHSIFPSLTFYKRSLNASGAANEIGPYVKTSFSGAAYYNAVPNLARWKEQGWGSIKGGLSGPIGGNPWNMEKSVLTGIDASQPFGW
ncbi:MAG TPA: hypothetical protein VIZ65_05935 [Cellvibrionaceae bacterium]